VLIIAANYDASTKLAAAFEDRLIKKTYLAKTQGLPPEESGEISGLIAKTRGGVFESVEESKDGKHALTRYKLLQKLGRQALIEFKPETGRMHQIRFHAQKLGCPIVGDCKYGGASKGSQLMLHAEIIEIPASVFGKRITIEAELPEYF
jgi:23S rRNA-/tRNA-specific pseudouridylate synthase